MGPGMGMGMGPGMGLGMQAGGPMGPPHSNALGAIGAWLNLTDEQKAQIRQIQEQGKADAEAAQDAVATARDGLHDAVIGGAAEADIRAAATALGEAIGNQAVLHAKTVAAAKAVLTDEQRKKFDEMRAKLPALRQRMPHAPGPFCPWADPNDPNQAAQASIQALGFGGPRMSLERMFKAADTNKDGFLTLEELRAFRDRVREARQENQ
jgi:Spy/CpxP family protein refolding chaperone